MHKVFAVAHLDVVEHGLGGPRQHGADGQVIQGAPCRERLQPAHRHAAPRPRRLSATHGQHQQACKLGSLSAHLCFRRPQMVLT